jgi:hypothetical protein
MPRRVALLIESLNSTAIDVTKILSNDVTDTAWQAYLKGDRGVFTRRAVRLLDSGEAREIQRHYDQEPEFREQVNRYIGDFEAMLRRILADGEGNTLAVTLLSSTWASSMWRSRRRSSTCGCDGERQPPGITQSRMSGPIQPLT